MSHQAYRRGRGTAQRANPLLDAELDAYLKQVKAWQRFYEFAGAFSACSGSALQAEFLAKFGAVLKLTDQSAAVGSESGNLFLKQESTFKSGNKENIMQDVAMTKPDATLTEPQTEEVRSQFRGGSEMQGGGKRGDLNSSYKVYVYSEPELKTIVPKSGRNAGSEVQLLSFRAYKRNFERKADGSFNQLEPTWMNVSYYGAAAPHLHGLIKAGMALRLDGFLQLHSYPGADGQLRKGFEFKADTLSLDLAQQGLQGIVYQRKAQEHTAQAYSNQDKSQAFKVQQDTQER